MKSSFRKIVGASAVTPRRMMRWRRRRPGAKFETPFGPRIIADGKSRFAKAAKRMARTAVKRFARKFQVAVKMRTFAGAAGGFPISERTKFHRGNSTGAFRTVTGFATAVKARFVVKARPFGFRFRKGLALRHDARGQKKRTPKDDAFEECAFHRISGDNQYSASDFRSRLISSPMMSAGFLSLKRTS